MEYGQFCPIAKACEILSERWTIPIIRELLCGSTRFNQFLRGLSQISPTLLTKRLNQLVDDEIIMKRKVQGMRHADEQGGLSGAPVRDRANHVLAAFRAALPAEVALIGTGGITEGADAAKKIQLGANLVQFYTGFVYKGPDLVSDCLKAIAAQSPA